MINLLKFLYSRVYTSYKKTSGTEPERIKFAASMVSFLLAFNVISIICIPLVILKSDSLILVFVFSGVITTFSVLGYLRSGNRHIKILKEVENYSEESRLKLKRNSTIYFLVTVVLFIWVWYHTLPFGMF